MSKELTQEEKDIVLNLEQIDEYEINPIIISFLKEEIRWLTVPFESVFNITLYESNESLLGFILLNSGFISFHLPSSGDIKDMSVISSVFITSLVLPR